MNFKKIYNLTESKPQLPVSSGFTFLVYFKFTPSLLELTQGKPKVNLKGSHRVNPVINVSLKAEAYFVFGIYEGQELQAVG